MNRFEAGHPAIHLNFDRDSDEGDRGVMKIWPNIDVATEPKLAGCCLSREQARGREEKVLEYLPYPVD